MKDTKNKVTAIAMATTIAVTSMAQVPATTVYAQELDKPQIEVKVNEENKEQDNVKVEAPVIENKKDEEVKEETNTVENNESAENKENTNDKVNEEEKDNVKEEEIKDNVENKEETEVKDNVENKEETEVKNDVEKNEATENTEIKDSNEKVEDKTSEKVENEELSKTEEVENKENKEKESAEEKVDGLAIDAANFPDEAFRNVISKKYDKNNDGVLSEKEVNDVREIWVSGNYDIKSLKGIENFKSLRVLSCYNTGITSLNVSNNLALEELNCSNTGITSLNVSNNTLLRSLNCSNTDLKNLDLSVNPSMQYVNCRNTGITSLSLANKSYSDVLIDSTSTRIVTVPSDSFDIKKELDIIDVSKIENMKGATLNGNIVSGYSYGTPITFDYNSGGTRFWNQSKISLHVMLYLKKSDVSNDSIKINANLDRVYNGTAVSLTKNDCTIIGNDGEVTFTYYKKNANGGWDAVSEAKNVGEYKVKAKLEGTSLEAEKEFKIEKATPKYEVPTNLTANLGQTLQDVKLPEGFAWVDATQSVGNAGANKFIANYTPKDTANYNVVENIEITVTVSKEVAPEVVEPRNLSATQDSLLSSIKLPEGWEWVNSDEQVTTGNEGYKARLKVDDNKYDYTNVQGYNADEHYVERTLKVFVSENKNEWTVVPSIKGWTYGEKANAPVGSAEHGDVTFTYSDSKDGKFESTVPSNAGTWYMKATVLLTENHTGLNEIIEFKIEKATPKYEIPTNLKATVGQILKDIKLPEGFAWVDATQSVGNAGANKFIAKYIPNDTQNYDVVENIEITVTVSNSNNSNNNNNNVGNNNNSSNGNNNSGNKDEVIVKPTLPQTGERNTLGLWGLVLTITGGAIAFITGKSSKTIRKEK